MELKKGIYDYFEDSLCGLGKEKFQVEHYDNTRDGNWYRMLPERGWASPRIIQHLPSHKIDRLLTMVRQGEFLLVELITHNIDQAEQAAKGI